MKAEMSSGRQHRVLAGAVYNVLDTCCSRQRQAEKSSEFSLSSVKFFLFFLFLLPFDVSYRCVCECLINLKLIVQEWFEVFLSLCSFAWSFVHKVSASSLSLNYFLVQRFSFEIITWNLQIMSCHWGTMKRNGSIWILRRGRQYWRAD